MTPIYKHDCDECVFLGGLKEARLDFYYCPQEGRPTVIVRYGHEPWEYRSGLALIKYDSALRRAYILARNAGLIKGVQHDT